MKSGNSQWVREQLGITQSMLAGFLSVHRTQVCRAEKGSKKLPVAALQKLSLLVSCLNEAMDAAAGTTCIPQTVALMKEQLKGTAGYETDCLWLDLLLVDTNSTKKPGIAGQGRPPINSIY